MRYAIYSRIFYNGIIDCPSQYGTLQFGKFEDIQEKGYRASLELLEKWDEEGKLPSGYVEGKEAVSKRKKKGRSARRNSI